MAATLPVAPLIVAVSGGADSASLAWAVRQSGRRARAVSIDHGLEGSPRLMEAARSIASALDMEHRIISVDQASDSETDLRAARLAALEAECGDRELIVTGHTRDDQAETVLGNVLRGAGTAGLAGIPAERGRWVRPMLGIGRDEARAVALEVGLPFVDDPQNADLAIRRNRLRAVTLPGLAAEFNPGLVAALARLGSAAAADEAVLEQRAARVPLTVRDGAILLPAACLQTLPAAVSVRVVRRALRRVGDDYAGDSDAVSAVMAAVAGVRTTIRDGIDVFREGPWVVLLSAETPTPDPIELRSDEDTAWGDWLLRTEPDGPSVGRFAASVPAGRLVVRAPRATDRISIGAGSKAVLDALAEASVPAGARSRWPLVEVDGTIVWIAGVRAAPATGGARMLVRAARRPR